MYELILIAAAVIPAIWLLVRVYQADKLEKEPLGMMVGIVLLGIVSTTLAAVTEQLGDAVLMGLFPKGGFLYNFLLYFVVVAVSEEGFKYLLLKLRTWKSPHFNCQFDGVVYAVFMSLGFALWENIGYVLQFGIGTALAQLRQYRGMPVSASLWASGTGQPNAWICSDARTNRKPQGEMLFSFRFCCMECMISLPPCRATG